MWYISAGMLSHVTAGIAVTILRCILTFSGLIDNNLALKFAINKKYITKNLQFLTLQNSQCLVETAGAEMRYYTCTKIWKHSQNIFVTLLLQVDELRNLDSCEHIWERGVGFAQTPPQVDILHHADVDVDTKYQSRTAKPPCTYLSLANTNTLSRMQIQNVTRFPNTTITGQSYFDYFLLVAGFQIFSRVFHADYTLENQVWQTIYLLFQWDDLSEPRDRGHRKQVTSFQLEFIVVQWSSEHFPIPDGWHCSFLQDYLSENLYYLFHPDNFPSQMGRLVHFSSQQTLPASLHQPCQHGWCFSSKCSHSKTL